MPEIDKTDDRGIRLAHFVLGHHQEALMFRQWFDTDSSTYTYLIADPATGRAVLIDPVLNTLDRDLQWIEEVGLKPAWVLDTHVHADHITAAAELRAHFGCKIAYPAPTEVAGADRLLDHGEHLVLDSLDLEVRLTPGHTVGSACYVDAANQRVFTGDTLLIRGCGRTDFQGGSASDLYRSVHQHLYSLNDSVRVYPGHDYQGRTVSTIGEERAHNPRLGIDIREATFLRIMNELDLAPPRRLEVAVPTNRRLGIASPNWSELRQAPSGATQAPIEWVRRHLATLRLIDVRQPDEYHGDLGHVPGAELVPLQTVAAAAESWARDQPLVVICQAGSRSDQAALLLQAMGFERVASMQGGTFGWNSYTSSNPNCG